MTKPRALVVGDVMLDNYVLGSSQRLSPEAPVPVVNVSQHDYRPGGAANVAAGLSALGVETSLLALTGLDEASQRLDTMLAHYGVDYRPVRAREARTTEKVRIISGTQQLVRFDYNISPSEEHILKLVSEYEKCLSEYQVVVFVDYAKGALKHLPAMMRMSRLVGVPAFVDPKVPNPEHYRGAFLIKPNLAELHGLLGPSAVEDSAASAKAAAEEYNWSNVVITKSSRGMVHVTPTDRPAYYPVIAKEVYDVSGAGDTVMSVLVWGYLIQQEWTKTLPLANRAAAIAISKPGTYVVSARELTDDCTEPTPTEKCVELSWLVDHIAKIRNCKKVVFTNGCFDLLHAGHIKLLKEAADLGDILVVGLNSDASVSRLKGPRRPVTAFADRAYLLSSLEMVSFVVGFEGDTPLDLIDALAPDVLAKGGDYHADEVVGAGVVRAKGGRVVIVPLESGKSTTGIIERLKF